MDDVRLLERIRGGDENAFAELFARHRVVVHRYAVHMAGRDSADDIVQEVFLALLRQLDRFDASQGELRSYLLGIARRQALKRFVRQGADRWPGNGHEDASEPIAQPAYPADPLEELTRAEAVARVRTAIAALPPVYREAVVLCELNELDYAAAAEIMECPIGTVRSRLHRARALLVARLRDMKPRTANCAE